MTKARMTFLCGVAAVAISAATNSATAAGAPPVETWGGFYVGGSLGAGWTNFLGSDSLAGPKLTPHTTSFMVGAHAGYNWQAAALVYGVEADISAAIGGKNTKYTCSGCTSGSFGQLSALATIRGRLGWAFDRSLIYATGGVAFARKRSGGFSSFAIARAEDDANWKVGGVVGAGYEWKYSKNMSLRLEALYNIFNERRTNRGGSTNYDGIRNTTVVRIGASWYLN